MHMPTAQAHETDQRSRNLWDSGMVPEPEPEPARESEPAQRRRRPPSSAHARPATNRDKRIWRRTSDRCRCRCWCAVQVLAPAQVPELARHRPVATHRSRRCRHRSRRRDQASCSRGGRGCRRWCRRGSRCGCRCRCTSGNPATTDARASADCDERIGRRATRGGRWRWTGRRRWWRALATTRRGSGDQLIRRAAEVPGINNVPVVQTPSRTDHRVEGTHLGAVGDDVCARPFGAPYPVTSTAPISIRVEVGADREKRAADRIERKVQRLIEAQPTRHESRIDDQISSRIENGRHRAGMNSPGDDVIVVRSIDVDRRRERAPPESEVRRRPDIAVRRANLAERGQCAAARPSPLPRGRSHRSRHSRRAPGRGCRRRLPEAPKE